MAALCCSWMCGRVWRVVVVVLQVDAVRSLQSCSGGSAARRAAAVTRAFAADGIPLLVASGHVVNQRSIPDVVAGNVRTAVAALESLGLQVSQLVEKEVAVEELRGRSAAAERGRREQVDTSSKASLMSSPQR